MGCPHRAPGHQLVTQLFRTSSTFWHGWREETRQPWGNPWKEHAKLRAKNWTGKPRTVRHVRNSNLCLKSEFWSGVISIQTPQVPRPCAVNLIQLMSQSLQSQRKILTSWTNHRMGTEVDQRESSPVKRIQDVVKVLGAHSSICQAFHMCFDIAVIEIKTSTYIKQVLRCPFPP